MATVFEYRLTTEDNPYNPFTQFEAWYLRDIQLGHNTCSRLARLTDNSGKLSEEEEKEDLDNAMNEMIKIFFLDNYYKVERPN